MTLLQVERLVEMTIGKPARALDESGSGPVKSTTAPDRDPCKLYAG